jgi:AraC-like DNA-binding protein
MANKLHFFTVLAILIIMLPELTHAKQSSEYVKYKQESHFYFQQKNYEQAYHYLYMADSVRQTEYQHELQKQENGKNKKVTYGIFIFILIDVLGLFFFMYLQKQRTYMHLVKKNMEWAQINTLQPDIAANKPMQRDITAVNQVDDSGKISGVLNYKEHDLFLRFVRLIKKEKIHLNVDINIQEVALLLNTNKHTLSKIINACFHKSFPALMNDYRIKEAINLLSNAKQSSVYTLEAIGEKSGFRSRQVFYMVFKKATGVTPNDFRKMLFSRDFREEYGDLSNI